MIIDTYHFDCVAIGDSIAVGVGKNLGCEMRAFVGYPSTKIIKLADGKYHRICIISAGSNDPDNPKLIDNLKKIRLAVKCTAVVWIAPINKTANKAVKYVAMKDNVVEIKLSVDNVHPKSYNTLARDIVSRLYK